MLDADDRQRRRIVLTGERARRFLLDLDKPVTLARRRRDDARGRRDRAGQRAGRSRSLEIAASSPREFVRLAWHLGNRHTDVQIGASASASAAITCWRRCCAGSVRR